MTFEQIMETIYNLSFSQGFYGRLLRDIYELKDNDPDRFEELKELWEGKNFKDSLDFILYLES